MMKRVGLLAAISLMACNGTASSSDTYAWTSPGPGIGASNERGTGSGAGGGFESSGRDLCDDKGTSMPSEGTCVGSVMTRCQDGAVYQMDCRTTQAEYPGTTLDGACVDLAGIGAWCAVPSGKPCIMADSGYVLACGGANGADRRFACDYAEGCVATSETCKPPTNGALFQPRCYGDTLIFDCTSWGQIVQASCIAPDISATGCRNGACVGVIAGMPCNEALRCADGLLCEEGFCAIDAGGECNFSDKLCATGLICERSICKVDEGGSCNAATFRYCKSGLYCTDGKCAP